MFEALDPTCHVVECESAALWLCLGFGACIPRPELVGIVLEGFLSPAVLIVVFRPVAARQQQYGQTSITHGHRHFLALQILLTVYFFVPQLKAPKRSHC